MKQEYSDTLAKFADVQDQVVGFRQLQGRYEELITTFEDIQNKYRSLSQVSEEQASKIESLERSAQFERSACQQLSVLLKNMFVPEQFESANQELVVIKQSIEDSNTYQAFAPFALRVKQMLSSNKGLSQEVEAVTKQNQQHKKDV